MNKIFVKFSKTISYMAGHPSAFAIALGIVIAWAICGPIFAFSETWQLVINTGTTIITFLMVFLIQSSQNRDTAALQLKLDELLRCTKGAHTVLLDLEELDEARLEEFRKECEKLAEKARKELKAGKSDVGIEEIDIQKIC